MIYQSVVNHSNTIKVNVSGLSKGIYIVRLVGSRVFSEKVAL